jgi:hypothetical protein
MHMKLGYLASWNYALRKAIETAIAMQQDKFALSVCYGPSTWK